MADSTFTTFANFSEADPWCSPALVMQHPRVLMCDTSAYFKGERDLDHCDRGFTAVSAAQPPALLIAREPRS